MHADQIRDLLDREPFQPFRIHLTSGDVRDVRDPHAVALMKNQLFVALPDDRSLFIPYLHIAAIKTVTAA